jgi:hypothetical protein
MLPQPLGLPQIIRGGQARDSFQDSQYLIAIVPGLDASTSVAMAY